jgi:hypothetical protein
LEPSPITSDISHLKQPSIARLIRLEEKESVIKEGELLKCSCGFSKGKRDPNYMPRWCQVTQNKFRYYKSRIAAYQNPGKPLLSIPLIEIVNIIKTKVNKNEVQIEIITVKDLSTYISERSLIEKAYDSPKRSKMN